MNIEKRISALEAANPLPDKPWVAVIVGVGESQDAVIQAAVTERGFSGVDDANWIIRQIVNPPVYPRGTPGVGDK